MALETIETIQKKLQSQALFDLYQGGESAMLKLVQVGKANRINTEEQATILVSLRFFFRAMGWDDWGEDFCTWIEDYQETCGVPTAETNSREMLKSALEWQSALEYERGKSNISIGLDGKK